MKGKRSLNLIKRIEQIEKLLKVNEIRIHYADEKVTEIPDSVAIWLRWLDVPCETSVSKSKR